MHHWPRSYKHSHNEIVHCYLNKMTIFYEQVVITVAKKIIRIPIDSYHGLLDFTSLIV